VRFVSYFTQYHYKIPGDAIMQTAEISSKAHIARTWEVHSRIARNESAEPRVHSRHLACVFCLSAVVENEVGL
jgi:hypothetical protein